MTSSSPSTNALRTSAPAISPETEVLKPIESSNNVDNNNVKVENNSNSFDLDFFGSS